MSGNILGTATGLTPTSLLVSTKMAITDQPTQTAIRQIENWANSFYVHNVGTFHGAYVTGGVSIVVANPFPNVNSGTVGTAFGVPAGVVTVNTLGLGSSGDPIIMQLWVLSTGLEVANGTTVTFFYDAWGN